MGTDYVTKDSGERQQFDTGMQRDTSSGKPRFDLIRPLAIPYNEQMLTRWAGLMERGARKYDPRNWEKASTQAELDRYKDSAARHFEQWLAGETDEDHAAAVLFNIQGAEYVRYRLQKKVEVGVKWVPEASSFVTFEFEARTFEDESLIRAKYTGNSAIPFLNQLLDNDEWEEVRFTNGTVDMYEQLIAEFWYPEETKITEAECVCAICVKGCKDCTVGIHTLGWG